MSYHYPIVIFGHKKLITKHLDYGTDGFLYSFTCLYS